MKKQWHLILPIVVFLVSCCDLGATLYFDRTCDNFQEANPIALHIWTNCGDTGLILFKTALTFASCICMGFVLKIKNRSWRVVVSVFGLLACVFLVGWWIIWFLVEHMSELYV